MTFLMPPGAPLYGEQLYARALSDWRNAEGLVCARWSTYLTAGAEDRPGAFAEYLAALDAEAAAADELELVYLPAAA